VKGSSSINCNHPELVVAVVETVSVAGVNQTGVAAETGCLPKCRTGIQGLDEITDGGLPLVACPHRRTQRRSLRRLAWLPEDLAGQGVLSTLMRWAALRVESRVCERRPR
jgi:hypothetical protein